jgi:hypothetical protein
MRYEDEPKSGSTALIAIVAMAAVVGGLMAVLLWAFA